MRLKIIFCTIWTSAVFCGCSLSDVSPGEGTGEEEAASFTLTYTIPDSTPINTRGTTYAGNVPAARESESRVTDLCLLFFESDDYGNGDYVGSLNGTIEGDNLAHTGLVSVSIPAGGAVNNDTDYNVLVIANASVYFPGFDFDAYCRGWSENLVKIRLQGNMPRTVSSDQKFDVTDTSLLMTGTTVKRAGKDMAVTLLRAAVRIDVRVADAVKEEIILTSATVSNVSAAIPLFSSPRDASFIALSYDGTVFSTDNVITGGLYVTEVLRTVDTPALRTAQATCVLVNCRKKDYMGNKTWYRANLSIGDDDVQYLKRNNVYTLEILDILTPGDETPDDAQNNEANLQIKAVLIPSDWDTPEGGTSPEVDVN